MKEAAERRVADAEARELAARVDVDLGRVQRQPVRRAGNLLARDQAEMERFARLASRLEDDQLTYATKGGVEQLRAVLSAYQAERDAMGRRLDLMLRAGVAERMEDQGGPAPERPGRRGAALRLCMTLFLADVSWPWPTRAPSSSTTRSWRSSSAGSGSAWNTRTR